MRAVRRRVLAGIFAALVAALAPAAGFADERILSFDSLIEVAPDGSMVVTETIAVRAEGRQIKRGIFRDFPTRYVDAAGNAYNVDFDVLEILRDGQDEPYHIERIGNGVRVYVGDRNVFIGDGQFTYTLVYRTDRQLGFFEKFDELYWNVTGNFWDFPIDAASATVALPGNPAIIQTAAYTGVRGARGGDYVYALDTSGRPHFRTTRTLAAGEGLTIAVAWPKGVVAEPTAADRAGHFLRDNAGRVIGAAAAVLLLLYYVTVWIRVGRDPKKGAIVPRFEPPANFTPAASRFVWHMGFDDVAFSAAILNMAVKGYLRIVETGGDYRLERTDGGDAAKLSRGERAAARKLLGDAAWIDLDNENHKEILGAKSALSRHLKAEYQKGHFVTNIGYWLVGLAISIVGLLALALQAEEIIVALFLTVWLFAWTMATVFMALAVRTAFRQTIRKGIGSVAGLIGLLFGEALGLTFYSIVAGVPSAVLLVTVVAIGAIFFELLKAPTLLGRRIMDEIEGFRMYLSVAEQPRLAMLNPPERTPELFERYLPYALALGVEHEWSEKFTDVLAAVKADGGYSPSWYRGRSGHAFSAGDFSRDMSGFSSAVGSVSAPGSSSGSGGGGSSGGGGGGGGGGGW